MTDADWQAGQDSDAMLRVVEGRFSNRQWRLMSCALARVAWEEPPPRLFAQILQSLECAGSHRETSEGLRLLPEKTQTAILEARKSAQQVQRAIVEPAVQEIFTYSYDRQPHPTAPLYNEAGEFATQSIGQASDAVQLAGHLTLNVLNHRPGPALISRLKIDLYDILQLRRESRIAAATALRLKEMADEILDRPGQRSRRRIAAIVEHRLNRERERNQHQHQQIRFTVQDAVERILASIIQDLAGQPMHDTKISPAWRTPDVIGLATAIDTETAYQHLPILADSLEESGCDNQAILAHCRNTLISEHFRGCWVIEQILEREVAYFSGLPLPASMPRSRRPASLR